MANSVEKRVRAQEIRVDETKSADLKLFEIFQIYKEDLLKSNTELYYALLGWKDVHLKELNKEYYKHHKVEDEDI